MEIIINTTAELSELDRAVLAVLAGTASTPTSQPVKAASTPAPAAKAEPKAAAAPKAEKAVEHAEEPVVADEPDAEVDRDAAVALATKLVSSGKAKEVKAALTELGAKKVSELADDDIAAFIDALS